MRLLIIHILLLSQVTLVAQLITTPNKVINGKKVGLWSELSYFTETDSTGNSHLAFNLHGTPLYILDEGYYKNNERSGLWKSFFIDQTNENNKTFYKKGSLCKIFDYSDKYRSLLIEYYKSGQVRVLGHYESVPVNIYDTIKIVDWANDPKGGIMKDSTIHTTSKLKPIGKWYYFIPDGKLNK